MSAIWIAIASISVLGLVGLGQRARQQREKILRALSAFSGQRAAGRVAVGHQQLLQCDHSGFLIDARWANSSIFF